MRTPLHTLGVFGLVTGGLAQTVEWVASTAEAPWVAQAGLVLATNRDDAPYDLEVRLDRRQQAIDGWGGCFNELGWIALRSLTPEVREEVLRNLFAPGVGLNFTICRTPIGASDYATNWYSLADTPGDFELKHFSLERDRALLLPYIKAALQWAGKNALPELHERYPKLKKVQTETECGDVIVFAVNSQNAPQTISVKLGGRSFEARLPAKSFNTFRVPGGPGSAAGATTR